MPAPNPAHYLCAHSNFIFSMAINITAVERWKEFYKIAAKFRDAAPWGWLRDKDIFGVKNPETGEIGWCCIMGAAGQHYALAVEEKKGDRPWHPCVLLAIQYGSGYILAQETAKYNELAQSLETFLLQTFVKIKGLPRQIAYHHPLIGVLLDDIAEKYDIDLVEIEGMKRPYWMSPNRSHNFYRQAFQ